MKKIKLLILLQFLFLTIAFIQVQVFKDKEKVLNTQDEQFYGVEDFGAVKKFDFHIHINTEQTSFIEQALAEIFDFWILLMTDPLDYPWMSSKKLPCLI